MAERRMLNEKILKTYCLDGPDEYSSCVIVELDNGRLYKTDIESTKWDEYTGNTDELRELDAFENNTIVSIKCSDEKSKYIELNDKRIVCMFMHDLMENSITRSGYWITDADEYDEMMDELNESNAM